MSVAASSLPAVRIREDRTIYRALRILEARLRTPGESFSGPETVRAWLKLNLAPMEIEIFAALFLCNQHSLIAWVELARGSIDGASVYPREVLKAALKHNAAAVILAHNHPSGITVPSAADKVLTARLKSSLALVDIRVLDHFIVGGTQRPFSFAENGLI